MKLLLIILGIIGVVGWLTLYIMYRLAIFSYIILHSAGKMKTGNDLEEQFEDTMKNESHYIPSFIQFYWRLVKNFR